MAKKEMMNNSETIKKTPKTKKINKSEFDETLLDNFVNLQKVLTNLSLKFDELSSNMSKLLDVFEISAKNFAEKHPEESEDKALAEKVNTLLDQNKTISKGIMLIEEKMRIKDPSSLNPIRKDMRLGSRTRPLPRY